MYWLQFMEKVKRKMPQKTINVRNGQLRFNIPEDIPKIYDSSKKILELIHEAEKEITEESEHEIDMGLRKNTSREFEKCFGMNSCKKTFGTRFPSYKAYVEFFEKLNVLLDKW